ncbi:hypothetical protein AAZV13_18G165400 [Glycine max]
MQFNIRFINIPMLQSQLLLLSLAC